MPTHLGTLTYDEIISGGANCEPVNREMYMSEEEFAQRMGCSKAEWGDVKQWKKDAGAGSFTNIKVDTVVIK